MGLLYDIKLFSLPSTHQSMNGYTKFKEILYAH